VKLPNETDDALPAIPIGFLKLIPPGKGLEHHRRARFSISLRPAFQGKGYETEAMRWLIEVGFRRANLNRIEGSYHLVNSSAAKCYKNLFVITVAYVCR
jgi:RimJ/RimL family protein N-acetyltransferase